MSTATAEKADETHAETEDPTLVSSTAPRAIHMSSQSTNPAVTPSAALTVQEDTVIDTEATPFLDDFVGLRDKSNKAKLTGVLKETVGILAPNTIAHGRSYQQMVKRHYLVWSPKAKLRLSCFRLPTRATC